MIIKCHDHHNHDDHHDHTNKSGNAPDKCEGAKGRGEQVDTKDLNKSRRGDCTPGEKYFKVLIKFMIRICRPKSRSEIVYQVHDQKVESW